MFLTFILLAPTQLLPLFQGQLIHWCDFIQDLHGTWNNMNLTNPHKWNGHRKKEEEMQSAKVWVIHWVQRVWDGEITQELQVQVLPLVLPSPLPPLHLTSSSKERWHPSYRNVVGPGTAGRGRLGNRERQRGSFLVGSSLIKPRTTIKALWLSWGWNPSNQQACSTSHGHSNCGRSAAQRTTKSTQRNKTNG